jgi:hypothetical protein
MARHYLFQFFASDCVQRAIQFSMQRVDSAFAPVKDGTYSEISWSDNRSIMATKRIALSVAQSAHGSAERSECSLSVSRAMQILSLFGSERLACTVSEISRALIFIQDEHVHPPEGRDRSVTGFATSQVQHETLRTVGEAVRKAATALGRLLNNEEQQNAA